MRHKEGIPIGQEQAYEKAVDYFKSLPSFRRNAQPFPVTQLELSVSTGLPLHKITALENKKDNYSPRKIINYASQLGSISCPIDGQEDYSKKLNDLVEANRKRNSNRDPEKNRQAQARWRQNHPELERERQRRKREKMRIRMVQ